jgi:hypothetical protein
LPGEVDPFQELSYGHTKTTGFLHYPLPPPSKKHVRFLDRPTCKASSEVAFLPKPGSSIRASLNAYSHLATIGWSWLASNKKGSGRGFATSAIRMFMVALVGKGGNARNPTLFS